LINNDAAIVASSRQDVYEKLNSLIMDKAKVLEYGEKAWECGKNNHQIDDFCKMIRSDLDV